MTATVPEFHRGYKIVDWPHKWTESTYESAREEIIAKLKDVPGIKAIVEFGLTTFPGVSDLDLYFIFDDDCPEINFPGYMIFKGQTREVITHDFFLVRHQDYVKRIHDFDPWIIGHRLLYGDPDIYQLPDRPFTGNEDKWFRLSHVFSSVREVQYILDMLDQKTLPARHLLDVICYAGYCLREVNNQSNSPVTSDFLDRLNYLRKHIVEDDPLTSCDALVELTHESLELFALAIQMLGDIVDSELTTLTHQSLKNSLSPWVNQNNLQGLLLTKRAALLFKDSLSAKELLERWRSPKVEMSFGFGPFKRDIHIRQLTLPHSLSGFFLGHLQGQGPFIDLVLSQYHGSTNSQATILKSDALKQRGQSSNDLWCWLRERRHPLSGGKVPHDDFDISFDRSWRSALLLKSLTKRWPQLASLQP